MLEFREIDRHNFRYILKLSTTESQKFFVATNAYSLSQAYAQPECLPLALYEGDTPVGFTMYGLDVEDTEYWIYRLMIDQRHPVQGLWAAGPGHGAGAHPPRQGAPQGVSQLQPRQRLGPGPVRERGLPPRRPHGPRGDRLSAGVGTVTPYL